MPPAKKQKNTRDSGVFAQNDGSDSDSAFESARPRKNDKRKSAQREGDPSQNASKSDAPPKHEPYEYICIHRPLFDVEGENWLAWSTNPSAHLDEDDLIDEVYKPNWEREEKEGIFRSSPEKHPGHKWVTMWDAWRKGDLLRRKAIYCDPDNFGMYIYNDWANWGLQEIIENMMIEFDKAYHSEGPKRLEEMWVVISALGFWLNEDKRMGILMRNDAEEVDMIVGLIGCALLTVLAAIEQAGELKPDSRFLDLTLVISYYLEVSYDLPAYGFEGDRIAWRKHAVNYFKKGNLDPAKGLCTTKSRIEKLEKVGNYGQEKDETDETEEESDTGATKQIAATGSAENPVTILEGEDATKENVDPQTTDKTSESPNDKNKKGSGGVKSSKGKDDKQEGDPWKWTKTFKAYKKKHHPKMGGQHYDITKMSRAERAKAAFDGKDPFAHIPAKDLKENLLDLA